jgi:hypothetical protein
VDEAVSFSMLPFSIYRSLRTDRAGNPVDLEQAGKGKTALTAKRWIGFQQKTVFIQQDNAIIKFLI